MENQEHPLFEVVRKLRYDLTAAQGKVTEILNQLAALELITPPMHDCRCGWRFRTFHELELHRYQHHDGPLPTAWQLADRRAGDAA